MTSLFFSDTESYGAKCQAYLYKPAVESDDEEEEIGEFKIEIPSVKYVKCG